MANKRKPRLIRANKLKVGDIVLINQKPLFLAEKRYHSSKPTFSVRHWHIGLELANMGINWVCSNSSVISFNSNQKIQVIK